MSLYSKLNANEKFNKFQSFFSTGWYILFCSVLTLLTNFFSLEVFAFALVCVQAIFIAFFCESTKPFIPLIANCYFMTSRKNSPTFQNQGIFFDNNMIIYMIVLVAIIILSLILRLFIRKDFKNITLKKMPLLIGLIAMSLAYMLSGVCSQYQSGLNVAYSALQTFAIAFLAIFFTATLKREEFSAKYLSQVMFSIAVVLCLEMVWLFFTVDNIFVDGKLIKEEIVTGWGLSNTIGAMLVFMLPFVFYLAKTEKLGYLYLIFTYVVCVFVFLTLSRGAIISVIVVEFIGLILTLKNSKSKRENIVVICISVVLFVALLAVFFKKLEEVFQLMLDKGLSLNGRGQMWEAGFKVFKENFIFGGGFFSCPIEFGDYQYMIVPVLYHNLFIQLIASCGVVGVVAFAIHFIQIARLTFKYPTKEKWLCFFACMVMYLISMFATYFFDLAPTLLYSIVLGFMQTFFISSKEEYYIKLKTDDTEGNETDYFIENEKA